MSSRKFADAVMPFLEKYNNYTEKDKIIAHYGLETIYMLVTKLIIITIISLILGITREFYILLFFYGLLRLYAGGLHLSNSLGCTILSIIMILGGAYLCIYASIDTSYRIIIAGIAISVFSLYSPADTNKKPIIKESQRIKRKIKSILLSFLYLILLFNIKNNFMLNVLTYSLLIQSLLISPSVYKLFNQPYNNYVVYGNYKRKEE